MLQKDRSVNYSKAEEDFIVECMQPYKSIIECKRTNTVTNKGKEDAWLHISETFNANSPAGIYRSAKQLQQKYKNLLKGLRRQNSDSMCDLMATGDGQGTAASDLSGSIVELSDHCGITIKDYQCGYDNDAIVGNDTFVPRAAKIEPQTTNGALQNSFQSTNDIEPGLPFRASVRAKVRRNVKSVLTTPFKTRQERAGGEDMCSAKKKYFVEENERARERHVAFMAEHKLRLESLALEVEEKRLRIQMKREAIDKKEYRSSSSCSGEDVLKLTILDAVDGHI